MVQIILGQFRLAVIIFMCEYNILVAGLV